MLCKMGKMLKSFINRSVYEVRFVESKILINGSLRELLPSCGQFDKGALCQLGCPL